MNKDKRNHHFVSQVLSKKFMTNEGIMYRYIKSQEVIKTVDSTRKLFSKRDLNATKDENGNIDYNSVEDHLDQNFETQFNKNYDVVVATAGLDAEIGAEYDNPDEITDSVNYLIGMGIIGQMRHPEHIEERNNTILNKLLEVSELLGTEELKNEMRSYIDRVSDVTNQIPLDFAEISKSVLKHMGELTYSIHIAPEDDYFILPDCSSANQRFELPPNIVEGKKYYNPAKPIGLIMMPINSRLMIVVNGRKFLPGHGNGVYPLTNKDVYNFNRTFFNNAFDEVVCENKDYLEAFLESVNAPFKVIGKKPKQSS